VQPVVPIGQLMRPPIVPRNTAFWQHWSRDPVKSVAFVRQFGIPTNTRYSATSGVSLASQQPPTYIGIAT
jgi:hypothetical protein